MLRLFLFAIILIFSFTSASHAGFEWLPPQDNPAKRGMDDFNIDIEPPPVADKMITPIYSAPNARQPDMNYDTPIARAYSAPDPFQSHKSVRPPAPSLSSGMSTYNTTRSTMSSYDSGRMAPRSPMARPSLTNAQDRPVSLRIDPYPMGRESNNPQSREMRATSVEQAMMEISQHVHPMAMGESLHTGAQMAYAGTPTVEVPENNPIGGMSPTTMAPVGSMGSVQTGPMNATTIRHYKKAEGFGADLPLALALNQVIPPEFSHSFALGVDPGTTVSWQGGKAWNLVLEDMLRPQGLTAMIKQNTVTIQPIMKL